LINFSRRTVLNQGSRIFRNPYADNSSLKPGSDLPETGPPWPGVSR